MLELLGLILALAIAWLGAWLLFTLALIASFLIGRGPLMPPKNTRVTVCGPGWQGDTYRDGARELRVLGWRKRWPA